MKTTKNSKLFLASIGFLFSALLFLNCQKDEILTNNDALYQTNNEGAKPDPVEGNNLSFPVIWSDGYEKVLREPPVPGEAFLEDEWWYVWGDEPIDPNSTIFSCKPNADNIELCEDGSVPGDGASQLYRAYIQKVASNVWQADNFPATEPLNVDLIDWGDNLESIDWTIKSQVRTELVLYENLPEPVLEYAMRHVSGWGTDEVHGLQTTQNGEPVFGPGNLATVYSHNARLTIQKLNIDRDLIVPGSLTWVPNEGWTETISSGDDIINTPIFNMAVYEAGDGPGYYSAEINVKGKIIFGYTWNVRRLNEGEGFYRITYSFDEVGGVVPLNTFFDESTEIIVPIEEFARSTSSVVEGQKGGLAVVDVGNNLTYMDILIVKNTGGGGGGNGGGGNGGGHGGD